MVWQPVNLSSICPANTHIPQCSLTGYIYLNLLVQLFGGSLDERIQHAIKEDGLGNVAKGTELYEEEEGAEFDFIVVGAGSAGCVVANRLTEISSWKVLLLEAGPEEPDVALVPGLSEPLQGSSIDWNYVLEPDHKSCLSRPNGRCGWPRGKVMGGSSSINTMVYVRGNRLDYDNWAEMSNEGWSYKNVLPYFKKMEKNLNIEKLNTKYHGTDGPQTISRYPFIDKPSILTTKTFNQLGIPIRDINAEDQSGTVQAQSFSKDGVRVSANTAYIQPIRYRRKNLTVRINSYVTKVLMNDQKEAYGVKYERDGQEFTAYAKKEVIVSGGVVNSAQLLLLSGIGPKEHLEDLNIKVVQDLPVGENLHDHLAFTGIVISLSDDIATTVSDKEMLQQVVKYATYKKKKGPLSSSGPYTGTTFLKSTCNMNEPDIEIQFAHIFWRPYMQEPILYQQLPLFPTNFYDGFIVRPQIVNVKSRGKLLLNATNPNGPPLIYANYLGDENDLIPIKRAMKLILELETTDFFKSGKANFVKVPLEACKNTLWGSDEYTECMTRHYTFPLSHQAGSVKMGPRWDETAVVDPKLRVYGVKGLRVVDCSIMPVSPRGNTNAPAMMVGEKGADLIKDDWLHH